ncbi:D-alanyl-D-alanine carboxypeptidase/D-alanyl-D-alanine-endopeptidase [Psychrobacter sp. I-STPA6b]|uniref:D-alanyl-D-alanine carboxypeptidase/D-alanyl-D-alanine-endopeptidase n=1 Tax=Psychrobacter sp. I-STPA6b TaxID=2585718 RepID=UPI001D0CA839|nr:D-alanyl-D-alanine carboxypeptidase [Psychrobacter sp. I-STPA6b]
MSLLPLPSPAIHHPLKTPLPRLFYKLMVSLSIGSIGSLAISTAHANLPPMVETKLAQAHLSSDDISLIIMPLAQTETGNRLPNITLPTTEESSLTTVSNSNTNTGTHTQTNAQIRIKPAPPLTTPIIHLPNTPRTPASTMKLIPTFVALDELGKDFVWQTLIYHNGVVVGDTLYGDMIIKGSGDPKLTHARLTQLLYQAQKTGIKHIHGNIILDTSIFQNVGKDPASFDNDPLRPYNASPDGLLVNFNSVEVVTTPSQQGGANVNYIPQLADYQLPKHLPYRSGNCSSSIQASLAPTWGTNGLQFHRALPTGCGIHTFYVAYPDVTDFARRVVKQKWQELGNTLTGQVITRTQLTHRKAHNKTPINQAPTYPQLADNPQRIGLTAWSTTPLPIASYPSQTLAQQIYDINHHSNNVMTEQLTLSLPVYSKHSTQTSTHTSYSDYPSSLQHIRQWWQSNLHTPPPIMTNGSGLCRDCTLTANNLAELLQTAYSHPDFNTYLDSLGIAGISGTIIGHAYRRPESQAIGRAWIKTGTLSNVTSMAGYVKGLSGQDYVVVGIINTQHPLNANQARPVLDAMLDWTAQH